MENNEKETEKTSLLTKRMVERRESVPWKRRRIPIPQIMEEGTDVR